ncbi:hypothetical protein [uncultured Bradyrhizobium sp.]|uniref:hypothetical protein n=1 Tax=uncultured Bradyrhizobium sp. TaxID=199684 RepID=UPI0035C9F0F4
MSLLQRSRYVLKLAIELIDDLAARPLRGIALVFGKLQFFRQACAQGAGARVGFAGALFHAVEDIGGLIHQVERRCAVVRRSGLRKSQYVRVFAGRTLSPVVPHVFTKLLICAERHMNVAFRNR